jgi:threonine dehydratase
MVEQIPGLDAVFIAIGGGGLISGVGAYLKAIAPNVEVIGCSPAASPAMHRCLEAGEIVDVPCRATLSGATAGGVEPGAITFDICREVVDRTVLVGEAHIADAMRHIIGTHHMLIEGAAGVAVAGYQQLASEYQNKTVGIVLCGANVSTPELRKILAG